MIPTTFQTYHFYVLSTVTEEAMACSFPESDCAKEDEQ
jgi:hypothetical protein